MHKNKRAELILQIPTHGMKDETEKFSRMWKKEKKKINENDVRKMINMEKKGKPREIASLLFLVTVC